MFNATVPEYLPRIASGELRLQSMAVTEPTTGTDTTKLKTTAGKKGDRYVINGQKVWISRIQHSDLMILLARTTQLNEVKKKSQGLSIFMVDLKEAIGNGMEVRPTQTCPGMRQMKCSSTTSKSPPQQVDRAVDPSRSSATIVNRGERDRRAAASRPSRPSVKASRGNIADVRRPCCLRAVPHSRAARPPRSRHPRGSSHAA